MPIKPQLNHFSCIPLCKIHWSFTSIGAILVSAPDLGMGWERLSALTASRLAFARRELCWAVEKGEWSLAPPGKRYGPQVALPRGRIFQPVVCGVSKI